METILAAAFFALGAVLASFAGVISERLDTGESIVAGRSKCNSCGRVLEAPDLIPILSWLCSGGRCRTCKAPVPYQYPVTEVIVGTLFVASYLALGLTVPLAWFLSSLFFLVCIVLYDLRHTIVPMTLASLFVLSSAAFATVSWRVPFLGQLFLTAGGIATGFLLLHIASKGKWMGLGDAPIALGLSLLVGTAALPGLIFSFWIGAVIGIIVLVGQPAGHRIGIEVPFVPFLAAGYLLAFFTQWNPFLF